MTTQTPARSLGRPRDPRLDTVIVEATLTLLADDGYAAVTMEAVAAAAGVGKATLYRRWPSKLELVVDAVQTLNEPLDLVSGASVQEQVLAMLEAIRRKSRSSLAGKIFPRLVSESAQNPELMTRYREQVIEPRRRAFAAVLQRGVDEGLLRADLDLGYACDLLLGPVVYRNLIRPEPPVGPDFTAAVVRDVFAALAPAASEEP